MRLRNILSHLLILMIVFAAAQVTAQTNPVVSNVSHSYDFGTGVITVTYDVSDPQGGTVTISMNVSSNSGTNWDYSSAQVTGDIGSGVAVGTGKTIAWTHDAEHGGPPTSESTFIVKVIANDGAVGGDDCGKVYYEGGPNSDGGGDYYNTIQIGDQCWLQENLNVGTRIDGGVAQTDNATIEKYCYSDLDAFCTAYGGLYQWDEAMQYVTSNGAQGICPTGWHIPNYNEQFRFLRDLVDNSGNALKSVGQGTGLGAGTNTSGFSALLSGYISPGGFFNALGKRFYIWSSTEHGGSDPATLGNYLRVSRDTDTILNLDQFLDQSYGFSIRCVKD